jgi:alkyldihydroxyacetonephosphate synthase
MRNRERRWYGWGYSDRAYSFDKRPTAWAYLKNNLALADTPPTPPPNANNLKLRPSRLSDAVLAALRAIVGDEWLLTTDAVRLEHALGKSYRDLIHLRQGQVVNPPDAVIFPASEDEVLKVLALANAQGLAVVPFGGGTSVVGGVEPLGETLTLTLNLTRLDQILQVDEMSHTVTAQAGIFGPELEKQLNAKDFTLGHFPQSFEFSTLGGWIAARGAGETSTKYGKIEERVVSLHMATPVGLVETRLVPSTAAGPSLLQMIVGSEGIYGVITQATLHLSHLATISREHAVLFHDFASGVEAIRTMMHRELTPALVRLSDEAETRSLFAMREAPQGWASIKEAVGRVLLNANGHSMDKGVLLLLRFEGNDSRTYADSEQALAICSANGGYDLGAGPVRSWRRDRYQTPYLRDALMDRHILVDTLETATEWGNIERLCHDLTATLTTAIEATGSKAIVLTHLSHVYHDGASIYVTFLAKQVVGGELEQWQGIKNAAMDCIMAHGGTVSHHHGVGYEHAKWMAIETGEAGLDALRAIKQSFDPNGILNPGKILEG